MCFFQRLKHMVADKIHSRNTGHVQVLTRQPLEGRGRNGGLRNGEMEQSLIATHGASQFQRSRGFTLADAFQMHVCQDCGLPATAVPDRSVSAPRRSRGRVHGAHGAHQCVPCQNTTRVSAVDCTWSAKLMMQEAEGLGVETRFNLEDF
jgi:DNA-directed RNA polymerase II subunit RPB2